MNIELLELMTATQRKQISKMAFDKAKEGILAIEVKPTKFNPNVIIDAIVKDFIEQVQQGNVGLGHQFDSALTNFMARSITKAFKE